MGSVRRDKSGKEFHWADRFYKRPLETAPIKKQKKQVNSFDGQQCLWGEAEAIAHLERKKK